CRSGAVAEAELPVGISPCNLILSSVLEKRTKLESMILPNPGQIVVEVECSVLLEPGICPKVRPRIRDVGVTLKAHVRNRCGRRYFIEQGEMNIVLARLQISVRTAYVTPHPAGSNGKFIEQGRLNGACQVEGEIPAGRFRRATARKLQLSHAGQL